MANEVAPNSFMDHAGTELSFALGLVRRQRTMHLIFRDGSEKIIKINGCRSIAFCCPSIEGTVIQVLFNDGTSAFYDVETCEEINQEFIERANAGERELPCPISMYC